MGLAISTGDLAYLLKEEPEEAEWIEEDISLINSALEEKGVRKHIEPKELPEVEMSCIESFPYSYLHYLRRVYALNKLGKEVSPTDGDLTEADDAIIQQVSEKMESHLLCHSDAEGYYVPIDFEDVIFDDELPGGMLGSSYKLLAEIMDIAELLNIELKDGNLTLASFDSLSEADEEHPFSIERIVWFALYEHCKNSVDNNTLIAFA